MKVAVTGGTGFLGRYIVNHLLEGGHACRCWYRPSSDRGGFVSSGGGIEWIEGRLGDGKSGEALVSGVDAVVHSALAWGGSAGRGLIDFAQTNLMGSLQLMQAARDAKAGRFVFIATCAVHEKILDDRPLDEAHPLWPTGHYGAHKAAIEKFVHSFGLGEGWAICSLRPTGIYGPKRPLEASRWYEMVQGVVRGEAVDSVRGGKEVHASDVARAVGLLLEADPGHITGEAFNCCDMYIADETVAEIAREISGSAAAIARRNHGPRHQIDTSKLRALGMTFGGEALLRETVRQLVEEKVDS